MEPANPQATLQELARQLEQARGLVQQLGRTWPTQAPPAPSADVDSDSYRDALRRANEAEVKLAKLEREMETLQARTRDSVRDVQRLAFEDPVTGLANLNLIRQHLKALKAEGQTLLLLVDLDRFQVVNEVLGQAAGNELLARIAERLSQVVSPSDALARRGEDEFVLVFPGIPQHHLEERARELASRIQTALATPFLVDGQKFEITASVGASFTPGQAATADELFQQADIALAHVKRQGRGHFKLYNANLKQRSQRQATLEFQMRHAIKADEFFMEYQPVVWLERTKRGLEGRMIGVEALVRWRHRIEGVLSPAEFLPLAEKSGLIVPLGHWILEQVLRQIQQWTNERVRVFTNVNLSGRQLLQVDFVDEVLALTRASSLPPGYMSFDIKEDFAALNEDRVDRTLARLAEAGFPLVFDNFGAGLSSFRRLTYARFLKLAPEVVRGEGDLCRKAVHTAAALELTPIGVGVETVEAARFLHQQGCSMVEGFYFSKPVDPDEITRLFKANHVWNC